MFKKILLFLLAVFITTNVFSQGRFDKWWDEVEKLELQGKAVSAFEKAEKIKRKANQKENPQQFLKAFLYIAKYKLILKKDSEAEVYQDFLREIENQNTPTQQLLYSFLAESLNDYYKENRYRIHQRTKIDSTTQDFLTWSKEDFQSKIISYYQKSLSAEQQLIEAPLKDFTEVLNYGENYKNYRSTLYDVLANRYLTFLKHHSYNPENKKSHFITETEFYGLPEDFVSIDFSNYEDVTQKIEILKTYQDLTHLHLQQKSSLSVVITTLERFEYLKDKGSYLTPNEHYEKALLRYLNNVEAPKEKAWVHYKLAEFYYKNANKKTTPDYLTKSLSQVGEIKELFPNSHPGKQALKIEHAITSSAITIKTKQKPLPNRKFRALVNFKNTDNLYLKVYKIPHNALTQYDFSQDSLAQDLYRNAKVFQQQEFQLPNIKNHFAYSTELLLDDLPVGNYLLLFSNANRIDLETSNYQFQQLQVTNISYTSFDFREDQQLFITDRTTGQPLENVKVFLKDKPKKVFTSNAEGLVKVHHRPNNNYRQKLITLIQKNDTLRASLRFRKNYTNNRNDELDPEIRSHLFTDRGIYRPGQTLYFKGILSYQSKTERKVVSGERVLVELYDANYDLVDSLSLKTNEFGSVQGEFKIPKNVLTGEFEITIDGDFEGNSPYYHIDFNDSYKNIQVEEYKRPKFEVEFNDIDSTYVISDSIRLRGKAVGFFGGNITNAKVKYTINRKLNNNYRYNYPYQSRASKRLTFGETSTDMKGNFNINFKANPDKNIDSDSQPIFTYSVEVTVTDVNGETHKASQNIRVGYHATEINLRAPYRPTIGENQELKIFAKDLNNLASTAKGELKVYKYVKPDRILTKRSWDAPEIQQISKEKFIEYFPFTPYDNLDLEKNWPKELISTIPLKIDSLKTIKIDNYKDEWRTGDYLFEFKGTGKLGYVVEATSKIKIKNPEDKLDQFDQNFVNYSYELKEKNGKQEITFNFMTPLDSLPILVNLALDDSLVKQKVFKLEKGENSFKYSVPAKTENIYIEYVFNQLGYYFTKNESVNLPKPATIRKSLEFEVITFKNKLEPGSQETWQLKVLDHDKKPANAEVIASMYDASLDEFVSHNWRTQLYRTPYSYKGNGLPGSSIHLNHYYTNFSYERYYRTPIYNSHTLNYSFFKNFGYHFTNTTNTNKIYLNHLIKETEKKEPKEGYVSGTVSNEQGLPLPGVNVVIKGTSTGTQTDFDGIYTLKANPDDILVFSYVGYNIKERPAKFAFNISLEQGEELDEVIVSGYKAIYNTYYPDNSKDSYSSSISKEVSSEFNQILQGGATGLEISAGSGQSGSSAAVRIRGNSSIGKTEDPLYLVDGKIIESEKFLEIPVNQILSINVLKDASATALYGSRAANGVVIITTKAAEEELQQVETRTNLQETAFFFPQLKTNKKGEVSFQFKSPEALTRWKFQAFAHDKNLHQAKLDLSTITQKELNILPNFPRFFRSKDSIIISAKVNNLSDKTLNGIIQLEFTDELTQKKIELILDAVSVKNFNIPSKGNTEVNWKLAIPEGLNAVRYRIVAKAGNFSDGEENIIPVFTNRIFITEALPIWLNPNEKETFILENLKNNTSPTLKNHQLIFEYTSNPVWTAIKALPYLVEYPYECAEQTFARYYANNLASHLLKQHPEIENILKDWEKKGGPTSDLNKNAELKNILIQETPWLKTAQSQEKQQQRLALLLDAKKSTQRAEDNLDKLALMQMSSGAFPWFTGGRENLSISLHILTSMERLENLNKQLSTNKKYQHIKDKLISYLDDKLIQNKSDENYYASLQLNFLYARSFNINNENENLKSFSKEVLNSYQDKWVSLSIQSQLTLALTAYRFDQKELSRNILEALKQNAVINSKYGMYWKELTKSYAWFNDAIATQALAIEAYHEIENDTKSVQQLKTWLLRNKKTESWKSTKATTEAIFALLNYSKNNASAEFPTIKIGDKKINPTPTETETGYYKTSFSAKEIEPQMSQIEVRNNSETSQYGGLYWQYFEESDKVKDNQQEQISISKELLKKVETNEGSILKSVTKESLALGDVIVVRLIINAKESFSFMHLKDMRASGLEPIDVISKYKYQDGLAYYQSTKDVATHFFFDNLKKGTYVLEYNLKVNNKGDFSNGITQLQSMYAPEFKSQTKGTRLKVN